MVVVFLYLASALDLIGNIYTFFTGSYARKDSEMLPVQPIFLIMLLVTFYGIQEFFCFRDRLQVSFLILSEFTRVN